MTQLVTSASGVNRSNPSDKPDLTLVDWELIERVAIHLGKHSAEKGRDNWRNARDEEDLLRFRQSAWRHHLALDRGLEDEDHAAALVWNVGGIELVRRRLKGEP